MTAKIPLSLAGDPAAFKVAVETHAADLRAFEAQKVAAEKTKGLKANDPKKVALYPAPVAHGVVDQAVRRPDLVPDFEIVDDVTPKLPQKKLAHLHALTVAEIEAAERVRPAMKRRLDAILFNEAMAKIEREPDGTVKRDRRSPKEKGLCDDHLARLDAYAKIEKRSAAAQAAIADLADHDVDKWSPPDLEKDQ